MKTYRQQIEDMTLDLLIEETQAALDHYYGTPPEQITERDVQNLNSLECEFLDRNLIQIFTELEAEAMVHELRLPTRKTGLESVILWASFLFLAIALALFLWR